MPQSLKPPPLQAGDAVRILSLASPVDESRLRVGCEEIEKLGFRTLSDDARVLARGDFFAGTAAERSAALKEALSETNSRGIFCSRGGYGSNYLLEGLSVALVAPKILLGFSDLTSLQIFLWQKFRWVTLYGPMVASGIDKGPGAEQGYHRASLMHALTETKSGWAIGLDDGEAMVPGTADGTLLGGCLTLIETALGTPWELDTHGAILLLEDRGMKPWQVDRALMHLIQAGKFAGVRGIIFGDFPDCVPPPDTATVREVCARILQPLGVPIVYGTPLGHTTRAMLTVPLGVRARLLSQGEGVLEIMEPAVTA